MRGQLQEKIKKGRLIPSSHSTASCLRLIVEGKVDFDTADADMVDCAKWKVLEIRRYTVFKNAECLTKNELSMTRQNWEDTDYPVVIWSNKKLGKKIDVHLKWRALYFNGE